MSVCVYLSVCIYIYIYICICAWQHVCICVFICLYRGVGDHICSSSNHRRADESLVISLFYLLIQGAYSENKQLVGKDPAYIPTKDFIPNSWNDFDTNVLAQNDICTVYIFAKNVSMCISFVVPSDKMCWSKMTCEICVVVYCTVHFQLIDSLNECLLQVWYCMHNATVIYQTYSTFHICPTMGFINSFQLIDPKSFYARSVLASRYCRCLFAITHHQFKSVYKTLVNVLSVLWSDPSWQSRSNVT